MDKVKRLWQMIVGKRPPVGDAGSADDSGTPVRAIADDTGNRARQMYGTADATAAGRARVMTQLEQCKGTLVSAEGIAEAEGIGERRLETAYGC